MNLMRFTGPLYNPWAKQYTSIADYKQLTVKVHHFVEVGHTSPQIKLENDSTANLATNINKCQASHIYE